MEMQTIDCNAPKCGATIKKSERVDAPLTLLALKNGWIIIRYGWGLEGGKAWICNECASDMREALR